MNKVRKIIKLLISLCIIGLILYLNIGTAYVIYKFDNYLNFSEILYKFGIVLFSLYILHKIVNLEKPKLKDILIILLGIFGYFSYKYAIDKNIALYGFYGRHEGLLVILTYYSLLLCASTLNKKYQKVIMGVLLFTGVFQVLIGIFQVLNVNNIFGYDRSRNFSTNFRAASGTMGNPNFYSTYMLICLTYCYINLIKSKGISLKVIYGSLSLLFGYGLFIGDTLSCIISFIIIFIISIIKLINKKNIKWVLIGSILLIIIGSIAIKTCDKVYGTKLERSIEKNIEEITSIFKNGITDRTGNGRIYVWKETLKRVPNNLINGIGIDNFAIINKGGYFMYAHEDGVQFFDKVHNEYLQKLITEGIFSFITYISLLGLVIYKFIKNKKDNYKYSLFLVFISYLIQATFNISVITVAPIFYMVMGFIINDDIVKE